MYEFSVICINHNCQIDKLYFLVGRFCCKTLHMLLVQVRAAYRCRLLCCAVAYMLKLTVGLNKPLLLNIRDLLKSLQYHKLQALRQLAKRPGR